MAQAFEFHFNPKSREDLTFDSFCYEPINIDEKRLGNLYIVAEIVNALPESHQFLNSLSSQIKKDYYLPSPLSRKGLGPEAALNRALKKTNEFLSQELQKENIEWLGNLNLAILSLSTPSINGKIDIKSGYNFYFTKLGDIKILLQRGKKLIDICSNLKINEIEPYPLKVFSNILSGELFENDLIFVLTQDIYNILLKEKIFHEMVNTPGFEEKIIKGEFIESVKKILNRKREVLSKTAGAFLLIDLIKETKFQKNPLFIIREKELSFLFEAFSVTSAFFRNFILKLKQVKNLPFPRSFPKISKIKLDFKVPKFSLSNFSKLFTPTPNKNRVPNAPKLTKLAFVMLWGFTSQFLKRNLTLIFLFAFILLFGFFIFQRENEKNLKVAEESFKKIEEKINTAQNFLILNKQREANLTFQDAWKDILPLTKFGSPIIKEATALKDKIENSLYPLNNLEKIGNPELFFGFNGKEFTPQKIFILGENIYVFSQYSQSLVKLSLSGDIFNLATPQKFNFGAIWDNSILFFQKPNVLFVFRNDNFEGPIKLNSYSTESDFKDFSLFNSNLYFLDTSKNDVIKYPYIGDLQWGIPSSWLNPQAKKPNNPESISVDGSVWILDYNFEIQRYYAGFWQENLKTNVFPYLEKPTQIQSQAGNLYILEPSNNRILILTKSGDIVKQFQSEKFDNLKDFTVSEDGKIIYFLNGNEIYQIST